MANKPERVKITKMDQLVVWKNRTTVDHMLDNDEPITTIVAWMATRGADVSGTLLFGYDKRRKEALTKGIQIETLMAQPHKKKKVPIKRTRASEDKVSRAVSKRTKTHTVYAKKVKSDMEFLDALIQKGMDTLDAMDSMNPQVAVKAIELKHKMTGGAHNGLTTYGLEEIRIREAAREETMTAVILKYVHPSQHDILLDEMETITAKYYESLGLGDQYDIQMNRLAAEEGEHESAQ